MSEARNFHFPKTVVQCNKEYNFAANIQIKHIFAWQAFYFFSLRGEEEVELGYHDAEFHFLHIIDHQWKYETVAKATLFPMEESVCYLYQQLLSNAKLVSH